MAYILFEDEHYGNLLPLVYFRPVWELFLGTSTIEQKNRCHFSGDFGYLARPYLQKYYLPPERDFSRLSPVEAHTFINGRWIVSAEDVQRLQHLAPDTALLHRDTVLAFRTSISTAAALQNDGPLDSTRIRATLKNRAEHPTPPRLINYLWDAVLQNGAEIVSDYRQSTPQGERAGTMYEGVHLVGDPAHIRVAAGAKIYPGVILIAEDGPVWIDEGAKIMANSVIEGPAYIGKKSVVKIGAKIYENTSVGPVCKVGGEVEGCIFQGYANKQHDGFLGHAYLGSWVNLGADTNNSDLKNNYGPIRVLLNGRPVDTGQQFLGLMMGDHSKTAINTMFNTGTIVGVCCNIFGAGMPPKFVPSFSWGGADGLQAYDFEKAQQVARTVMARRKVAFTEKDRQIFSAVQALAAKMESGSLL